MHINVVMNNLIMIGKKTFGNSMFRFNKDNHIILLQNTWLTCYLFFSCLVGISFRCIQFPRTMFLLCVNNLSSYNVVLLLLTIVLCPRPELLPEDVTKLFDYLRNHDVH